MRFLIIDTDYPWFLDWLYGQYQGLEKESYQKQLQARADSLFACGLSYSSNLRKLGHEADQIFFNNEHLQMAWAREHGVKIDRNWQFRMRRGLVPWVSRLRDPNWLYDILTAQVKYYKPDVLLNNAMRLSTGYFRDLKPYFRLLVGSHGSPLPEDRDFGIYDLVLSVVENLVDYFRREGLKSELLRLAFEPLVLERVTNGKERSIPVSFVGQITHDHASRLRWLNYVCERIPVEIWSPSTNGFHQGSHVVRSRRGTAWGVEMYGILCKSMVTLNHHIDMADVYAGNGRLFEATGMGTLLVTDWKKNLHEMFEPGKEVVAYRTADECVDMIQYYLEHDEERKAIGRAGQQRTLRDHTYYQRMQQLTDIVQKYV